MGTFTSRFKWEALAAPQEMGVGQEATIMVITCQYFYI